MPRFKYKAQSVEGKIVRGTTDAPDEAVLYTQLKSEGMFLVESKDVTDSQLKATKKLKAPILADFCRQIGTLLEAGVSLIRALNIMSTETGVNKDARAVYENLGVLIRQGIPLSDAMEQQGKAFPDMLINMMRSAEANGNIDRTMLRLATHYEKEHKLNGKVKNAMIYPIILSCLLVVVIVFVMVYMVPQFSDVFDQMNSSLPLPTKILLGISNALQHQWVIILVVIAAIVIACGFLFRIPKVREAKDHLVLKLPLVGKLICKIYTARFARSLCSLYTSGIPIIVALQISSRTIGNLYIENQFEPAIEKIRAGATLSATLQEIDGFQNKLASTIMVGEETGSLDSMLESIADNLEFEAEQAMERLVTMMEPILIILMAIVIGFVMIAVILPIYQSYSTIQQG